MRCRPTVVGIGETRIGRFPERSYLDLQTEAACLALADAGLPKEAVDGVFVNTPIRNPTFMAATALVKRLGLKPRVAATLDAHGAAACLLVAHAAASLEAGLCEVALCAIAREGYVGRDRPLRASLLMGGEDFEEPFGLVAPVVCYALAARRHMHKFGTTSLQLGAVAVAMRRHASLNENAQKREPITLEDHQASPLVSDPLRLLDCCLVSDCGGALVLTTADRARDLPRRPVRLLSFAEAQSHLLVCEAESLSTPVGKELSNRLFGKAGLSPPDVGLALLYDSFTITVLIQLELYGFCARGESGAFVEGGHIELEGDLPVNTHGGLLSQGHSEGFFHLTEGVRQLRGDGGNRQVEDLEVALVTGAGGQALGSLSALLLGKG